jgi:hypothetical protein
MLPARGRCFRALQEEPAALRDHAEALGAGLGGELTGELPGFAGAAARQRQLGLEETALQLVGYEAAAPRQLQPFIDRGPGGVELTAGEEHLGPHPQDRERAERLARRVQDGQRASALAVRCREISGHEVGESEAGA